MPERWDQERVEAVGTARIKGRTIAESAAVNLAANDGSDCV